MQTSRPVLAIPRSTMERFLEFVAGAALLAQIAIFAFFWDAIPERVPSHFDFLGKPDAWGSKRTLFILAAVALASYLGLTVMRRYPHDFNYPFAITAGNAERQYRLAVALIAWLKAEIGLLFAFLLIQTIRTGDGKAEGLGEWFLPAVIITVLGTGALYALRAWNA